jgi:hypothetical protein
MLLLKNKRFSPYTKQKKTIKTKQLPFETIEIIFEWLVCIHIIEPIINGHIIENINHPDHPKRIFDNLRLVSKPTKRWCEFLFTEWLSNEFKIFDNKPEILCFYFEYIYNFFKDVYYPEDYSDYLDKKIIKMIFSEYNFWKIILLNICIRPEAEYLTDLVINFGCFKFFKIYPFNNYEPIQCFCGLKLNLHRSSDKMYWYITCKKCKFYKVIIKYIKI